MEKSELAKGLFKEGYNCAQAVAVAFAEELGMDKQTIAKMMSSFGGGLGRQREVCGAVSGMCFVIGALQGYNDPKGQAEKMQHYQTVRDMCAEFKAECGSIICRELLEGVQVTSGGVPEERTTEYYKKRPCAEYVALAGKIAEKYIK